MLVDVVTEIDIARSPEEVFRFAGDPGNAPKWYINIKSVEWITDPPPVEGSKIDFVAQFLGRRLAYTYEIVELIPDRKLVMKTSEGPFPMETTYTFEPGSDGGTRMTLRNRGNPAGFSRISAPFMKRAMRRANQKDLELLKLILESDQQ